jgi:hypothetical protein
VLKCYGRAHGGATWSVSCAVHRPATIDTHRPASYTSAVDAVSAQEPPGNSDGSEAVSTSSHRTSKAGPPTMSRWFVLARAGPCAAVASTGQADHPAEVATVGGNASCQE